MNRRSSLRATRIGPSGLIVLISALWVGWTPILSHAEPFVLTFEGLEPGEPIRNYYAGGTGGSGSLGPDLGVRFGAMGTAALDFDAGGSANMANEPSGEAALLFPMSGDRSLTRIAGFTTGFSFYYSSASGGTVTVYDGFYASANVLATIVLEAQGTYLEGCPSPGDPGGQFACWSTAGATFEGVAVRVDFSGAGTSFFDNVTIESAVPLPEPDRAAVPGLLFISWLAQRRAKRPVGLSRA